MIFYVDFDIVVEEGIDSSDIYFNVLWVFKDVVFLKRLLLDNGDLLMLYLLFIIGMYCRFRNESNLLSILV